MKIKNQESKNPACRQVGKFQYVPMSNNENSKKFDLEERSTAFAKRTRDYVKRLPKSTLHLEYGKQLIRSSGSVPANYIEANEALGDKDFTMKMKTCRKEAKESRLWLDLTEPSAQDEKEKIALMKEATELVYIFSSIIRNRTKS